MQEAIVFLGQAALILAAMLVVLFMVVCLVAMLVWVRRQLRQM